MDVPLATKAESKAAAELLAAAAEAIRTTVPEVWRGPVRSGVRSAPSPWRLWTPTLRFSGAIMPPSSTSLKKHMDAKMAKAGMAKHCANVTAAQLSASSSLGTVTTCDGASHEGIDDLTTALNQYVDDFLGSVGQVPDFGRLRAVIRIV